MTIGGGAVWALSVSPPHTEVHLPPGGVTTAVITVANPHAEPYDVELSEKPWFDYPDNRTIHVEDWLKLPGRKHFRLKPGKSREVKITIRCPKDAIGELMGMVSFAYQGMTPSMITPMISTAVYLEVEGTERNTAEVQAIGAGTRNGQFQVGVKIKVTGNVRLRPAGAVRLLKDSGEMVSIYTIAEPTPAFPGTIREYAGRGPASPPPAGHYKLVAELSSGTLQVKAEQGIVVKANGDVEMDAKKEAPQP